MYNTKHYKTSRENYPNDSQIQESDSGKQQRILYDCLLLDVTDSSLVTGHPIFPNFYY